MQYDLHLHSALSPCANDDMTPAAIVGMAKLAGADLMAITDHNSALNLPAAAKAAAVYGVRLLPGIEVNTEEEIHLLCYFADVARALAFGEILYEALPAFPYDPKIWGRQLWMDEDDNIIGTVGKLLTGAVTMDIYTVVAQCEKLGGIAIPAHVDKDSYSLLSVLGFAPEDLPFEAFEVRNLDRLAKLLEAQRLPAGKEILTSSDAHQLEDIAKELHTLSENSILRRLL